MKLTLSLLLLLTLCGCQSTPIRTQVEIIRANGESFKYSSEKDVICKVELDPETREIVAFSLDSVASAPAYAKIEADKVQAQQNLAITQTIAELVAKAPRNFITP